MAGEDRRTAGTTDYREMPANVDLEALVLGTLLSSNGVYSKVSQILTPECFHEELHRIVYQYAAALMQEGKPATPITLRSYLHDQDLGGVSMTEYLSRLAGQAAPPAQISNYSQMLVDLAQRRRAISVAQTALDMAYDLRPDITTKAIVDVALDGFAGIQTTPGEVTGFVDFQAASMSALLQAQEAHKRGANKLVGLSTGMSRLDDAMGGLQAPDFIVLAGRPGMGKTSLATNIAYAVAEQADRDTKEGKKTGGVGFFSLEMSEAQLAARIISEQSGVHSWKVRRGLASSSEMERYVLQQRELQRLPLYIDPTGGISIGALRVRARELKRKRGLSLIIVDYLQLITSGDRPGRDRNRVQELTEITGGLKALAKELDVPVIALSQLSRRVEERDDKRPMLSDLRESGSIEQDADSVLFIYRDEYYIRDWGKRLEEGTLEHADYLRTLHRVKGVAEAIIAKNRHGPAQTVELGFDGDLMKFLNEPYYRDPEPDLPEIKRKKPKPPNPKTPEGWALYRALKGLAPAGHEKVEGVRVPQGVRLIDRDEALRVFARELYGPEADPKEYIGPMQKAFRELNKEGLARWSGTKDRPMFWLPEMEK